MARPVALVLDPAFGEALEPLSFRMPVWIVESEPNRAAAQQAWTAAQQWPQIQVTIFRATGGMTKDDWSAVLGQIELHHGPQSQRRPYDALEVIGAAATPAARVAFEEAGFGSLEETAGGFRAGKK